MRKLIAYLFVAAVAVASFPAAAATLYLTEFSASPSQTVQYQAAKAPALVYQTVAVGGSSTQSAAFNGLTGLIRLQCDVVCDVVVGGTNPTATTTSLRLAAGQTEYFTVNPGDKVAVIAGT